MIEEPASSGMEMLLNLLRLETTADSHVSLSSLRFHTAHSITAKITKNTKKRTNNERRYSTVPSASPSLIVMSPCSVVSTSAYVPTNGSYFRVLLNTGKRNLTTTVFCSTENLCGNFCEFPSIMTVSWTSSLMSDFVSTNIL